jgi:hypothetical protein
MRNSRPKAITAVQDSLLLVDSLEASLEWRTDAAWAEE